MSKVTSCVKDYNGAPTLFINGIPVKGAAYITYYTHRACYSDFASAGYSLFSMPAYFAGSTINETTQIPPFKKGIFDNRTPDFSEFDADVLKITEACPGAAIFPRVNVSPAAWWEDENPDELCDTGYTEHKRVCFSSKKFIDNAKENLELLVKHIEESPYCDNIVGYQIAGGNTDEWFSFDQKGSLGKRLYERCTGLSETEFYRRISETVREDICALARFVKELTDYRLVVGTFYGYTLECVERTSCHHDLGAMLKSDCIDFICSPVSYAYARELKRDHANMLPIDSVKLHNKLYFAENDTRTHLSGAPYKDIPYYNDAIWRGPERPVSDRILKMHFARAVCHGHAFWWFDMWGQWYTEYMDIMKSFADIASEANERSKKSSAQVAVFVDERAYDGIPNDDASGKRVCYEIRQALGRAGATYDIFLADDFNEVHNNYKAVVFLVPRETAAISAAVALHKQNYIVINGENADISTDELRKFYKLCGVNLYCEADAVVYESESYLFVHTCNDEAYPNVPYTEVFGEKITPGAGKSYLFRKE